MKLYYQNLFAEEVGVSTSNHILSKFICGRIGSLNVKSYIIKIYLRKNWEPQRQIIYYQNLFAEELGVSMSNQLSKFIC